MDETREIVLTQGKVALVDAADYEWLSQWEWYAIETEHTWYAARATSSKDDRNAVRMHRVILRAKRDALVDHRDGNGLNNQRHNLRVANRHQNCCNRKIQKNNISGFKGVSWYARDQRWRAKIGVNGKHIHLGYFDSVVRAACAYDAAARELHGEFARLNFPR